MILIPICLASTFITYYCSMLSSAKYLSLPFLFFLFLFKVNSPSHAQETIDIRPFIDTWKIKDGTQTIKFEETIDWGMYSPATGEIDTDRYRQVLKTVRSYLKKHPDDRIETRALMFESVGKELDTYYYLLPVS